MPGREAYESCPRQAVPGEVAQDESRRASGLGKVSGAGRPGTKAGLGASLGYGHLRRGFRPAQPA
jgi:hypothetical protein